MVEKTIIANYGDENLGKTETVKMVYELLRRIADDEKILHKAKDNNGDMCAVLTINNTIVGISSPGDPDSAQEDWLKELITDYKCDIIVAASRYDDNDNTVKAIESYSSTYRIIWTCNARIYHYADKKHTRIAPRSLQRSFNDQWAEEIANLIDSWCYA